MWGEVTYIRMKKGAIRPSGVIKSNISEKKVLPGAMRVKYAFSALSIRPAVISVSEERT